MQGTVGESEGGVLIPVWPSDRPGTIERARGSLSPARGWPEVAAAVGVMTWPMERQPGPSGSGHYPVTIDLVELPAALRPGMTVRVAFGSSAAAEPARGTLP